MRDWGRDLKQLIKQSVEERAQVGRQPSQVTLRFDLGCIGYAKTHGLIFHWGIRIHIALNA